MNTSDRVIKNYKDLVDWKITELSDKINNVKKSIKVCVNYILLNKDKVLEFNPIITYITNVNKGILKLKVLEVIRVFSGVNIREDIILSKVSKLDKDLIVNNYTNYKNYVIKLASLYKELNIHKSINFDDYLIRKLFVTYYKNVAYELLRPGGVSFALPTGIVIKIKGKDRQKVVDTYGFKKKINWGESISVLKAIAKDEQPDIYKRYINKELTKKEFVAEMKPYTYNKENNPKGKKWLVTVKDINFWLIMYRGYADIENFENYSIVPTNYINFKVRSQIEYSKNVKDVEEVIVCDKLGFRDKIRIIERVNMNYCLNNWSNDIQASK